MWFRKVLLPWMISTGHNIRLKEWYCLATRISLTIFHPQQFPDFTGGNEIITSKGGTTRWFHFRSLVYGEESPTTTYYSLWSNTAKSYPQGAVKKAVWESIRNCYNVLNNLDRVSDITPKT